MEYKIPKQKGQISDWHNPVLDNPGVRSNEPNKVVKYGYLKAWISLLGGEEVQKI